MIPTLKEVQDVHKAAELASPPGPSKVPYIVYKHGLGV